MSFAADLAKFAAKTEQRIDQCVRATVLTMGNNIILASPVDTGRFRANWHVTFDIPDRVIFDDVDRVGAETSATAAAAMTDFELGQVAYFINNLPYAIPLEYGHSKQAPAGMVRVEVARFQMVVRDAVKALP